jgi:vacuolar protein sorting-associated protein 13A/C
MFEAVLERLLVKYLGRFIKDLNKNNLHVGVWKGNVVIENMVLKEDIVDMLGIPFKLMFSNVGSL